MTGKRTATRTAVVSGVLLMVMAMLGGIAWGSADVTKAKRVDAVTIYYIDAEPGTGEQHVQLLNLGGVIFVTNSTSNRVLVTWGEDPNVAGGDYMWLAPGASDPVFGFGQWVNEENATDLGRGTVYTFAILNHDGASATGMLAWSAAVDPGDPDVSGDEMGECVFSIQARG